jgi:hypothetical protein
MIANLCIDGALLNRVESLAIHDNNNVEVNTQPSGAFSMELAKVTAKKCPPNADQ